MTVSQLVFCNFSLLRHFNQRTQSKSGNQTLKKATIHFYGLISLAVNCEVIKYKRLEIVTHLCCRLLADLNSPMYVPEIISLDRKHILEDIESKYRDFITSTLRCLSELKRELRECLTGDTQSPCSPVLPQMRKVQPLLHWLAPLFRKCVLKCSVLAISPL